MGLSLGMQVSVGNVGLDTGGVFLTYAPAEDQPIITSGAGAPVFATQTQHFLLRQGDNTTNVDTVNDTKFRYPGMPTNSFGPDSRNNARATALIMPGGTAQGRRWDIAIEFTTSSKYVALVANSPGGNPQAIIVVNGKWVSDAFYYDLGGAGVTGNMLLEFPDRRPRRIKFIVPGALGVTRFETESAYPPVRSTGNTTVLLAIGDSLSAGSGTPPTGASSVNTWPQAVATMLGFDHCCNASIGGTKWVPSGTGDVAVSHFGGGRLSMALTTSPSAIVAAGSRNDTASIQADLDAITAAVQQFVIDTASVSKRFIAGTFTALPQNPAVKLGAGAVPFIDMTDGLRPEDIGTDTVHPTYSGAVSLRNRFAPRLLKAGCTP